MTTFECMDDVLTLLVHLGYLGYDFLKSEVFIPNYEVAMEFVNAVKGAGWDEVAAAVKASDQLRKQHGIAMKLQLLPELHRHILKHQY